MSLIAPLSNCQSHPPSTHSTSVHEFWSVPDPRLNAFGLLLHLKCIICRLSAAGCGRTSDEVVLLTLISGWVARRVGLTYPASKTGVKSSVYLAHAPSKHWTLATEVRTASRQVKSRRWNRQTRLITASTPGQWPICSYPHLETR
jgi:hypothetical protein